MIFIVPYYLFLLCASFILKPIKGLSLGLIFMLSWTIFVIFKLFFAENLYTSINAFFIISIALLAFIIGDYFGILTGKKKFENQEIHLKTYYPSENKLKKYILILGILSLFGAFNYAYALGLFEFQDLNSLIISIGITREKLAFEDITIPYTSRIGFLLSYSSVVVALSYYFFYGWRWILAFPFISVLIMGISQAGRAGLAIILLQFAIANFYRSVYIKGKSILNTLKKSLIFFLIMVLIFVLGQLLRDGKMLDNSNDLAIIFASLKDYTFGGAAAFSYYVDNIMDITNVTYGKYSFSSLYSFLGISKQEVGIYDQYVIISNNGNVSNVYTVFRSFIDDFTIFGMFVFFFLTGFLSGRIFQKFKFGDYKLITLLLPILSWILFSPIASLTYFNSFLLSCILPVIIVNICIDSKKVKNDNRIHLRKL